MKSKFKIIAVVCSLFFIFMVFQGAVCKETGRETESPSDLESLRSRLSLETEIDPEADLKISKGTFAVYEDRESRTGRIIHLSVIVLHAKTENPRPDPIFILAGGPGADVTQRETSLKTSWYLEDRDVVLVSQRGTGGDNKLDCVLAANDENVQSYLDPLFEPAAFRTCLEELEKKYDLTKYSTCLAADDLNDVRLALGYEKINLTGTSYGTRMALVYMRRHPETVRTAILNGVVPIAFKNPLFHAPAAQEALGRLFKECENDPECHKAFPQIEEEFNSILKRLDEDPVEVIVDHPATKKQTSIRLDRAAFSEALRTMMYDLNSSIEVPFLIHEAYKGDFIPFAETGIESSRGIRRSLAVAMLLCVTCAEDLARISEQEIIDATYGTYLGDGRVRQQMAICEFWPRSIIPKEYGEPVRLNIPVLVLSGTLDPVTPPQWGAEAASHLSSSLHLIVPGSHGVGGKCIRAIQEQFLDLGSVNELDVSCTENMRLPSFKVE